MNQKRTALVQSYLLCGCATEAARHAGYSAATAHSQGHRLLKNAEIQKAVSLGQQEAAKKAEVNLERVVRELAAIAFGERRDGLKIRALELLGRRVGLFAQVRESHDSGSLQNTIDQLLERARSFKAE